VIYCCALRDLRASAANSNRAGSSLWPIAAAARTSAPRPGRRPLCSRTSKRRRRRRRKLSKLSRVPGSGPSLMSFGCCGRSLKVGARGVARPLAERTSEPPVARGSHSRRQGSRGETTGGGQTGRSLATDLGPPPLVPLSPINHPIFCLNKLGPLGRRRLPSLTCGCSGGGCSGCGGDNSSSSSSRAAAAAAAVPNGANCGPLP